VTHAGADRWRLAAGLAAAALALAGLAGFLAGGRAGSWLAAACAAGLPAALLPLAVAGQRRRRRVLAVAVVLGLSLAASLAGLLVLAGRLAEAPWPAGVPLALWLLFAGLWLVPLLVTGLGHAWAFAGEEVEPAALARLRRAAEAEAEDAPPPASGRG
jgi:hypothetical protein